MAGALMSLIEAICSRRSIRAFTPEPPGAGQIRQIIAAGTRAPSGLNNQPWRFAVVTRQETREALAGLTRYGRIIRSAPVLVVVFCAREAMYHDVKDHQAIGACIQNMLLATQHLALGAVWLGEILKNADTVNSILGLDANLELMAVLAIGHPAEQPAQTRRQPLDSVIVYHD